MQLRPYQQAAVDAVYNHLRDRDDNPCVVIPTAGGKTPCMATICKDAVALWQGRVLVLAHVKELLQQTADKLTAVCPEVDFGIYSAGLKRRDTNNAVIIAGIQSIYKRACELDRFDLIIVDEAHLISPDGEGMYQQFLADAKKVNPHLRIIGFTATPFRLKDGEICAPENILNTICYEVGIKELIRDGFLCPLISKSGKEQIDFGSLHIRAGEFVADEVEALMEKNLAGGRVEVTIETKDGLQYIVSRSSGDEPIVLNVDRQPTDISFKTGMVFGADIYSQNEVETIADCKASQLALLDKFQADAIADIESRIEHITSQLAANANQIVPLQQRIAALTDELATLASVEEKLARFGAAGGQDAATINKAHNLKALLDREVASGPNGKMVQELLNVVTQCGVAIDQLLQDAKGKIAESINQVTAMGTRLTTTHRQQEMEFQALIEKHQEAQGQAAERAKLERLRNDLLAKQRQKQQNIEQLGNLETQRQNLVRQLSEQRDERFAVREAIIKNINANLAPAIRVSISQNGNPERYQRILEDGLKSARVKHVIVAQKIVDAFVPWDLVVALRRRDSGVLIERAELNPDQAEKVVTAMANSSVLFELETVELMDLPTIELKDGATYKESLSLSTGQKCTTVLPLLLLESANPLLVDQPEDNLDNRFISEAVVEAILKMKSRRQMIFVTHNPNIPVLGDAERVFVLDSDGATARKSNEGTVDECKREIVNLLEGGENAFKVRKCRYRFNDWITIRDTRKAEADPIEIEDTPASRRLRILELLGDGGKLRSTCIANHLGCSLKTVKRELETLRLAGRIEFIGPSKTGTYQLVGT